MSNPEIQSIEMRKGAVTHSLKTLSNYMREGLPETQVAVGFNRSVPIESFPQHVKQILEIAEIDPSTNAYFEFVQFNPYEKFKPNFSFGIETDRPQGPEAFNNMFHFSIKENPEPEFISWTPADEKTVFLSSGFPHIAHHNRGWINLVDVDIQKRRAVEQKYKVDELMDDEVFRIGLAEELTALTKSLIVDGAGIEPATFAV